MKKIFLIFAAAIICASVPTFAHDEPSAPSNAAENAAPIKLFSGFLTIGPHGMLNKHNDSAPSPILFSIGGAFDFRLKQYFSLQIATQFHLGYYLYDNIAQTVLPAEVEHRTALAFSVLLDIPAVFHFAKGKNDFFVGLGASLFLRLGILPQGVPDSESDVVSAINSWFWQKMHFVYPMAMIGYDRMLSNGWKIGLCAKAYYPIANILSEEDSSIHPLQNAMLNISVRVGK